MLCSRLGVLAMAKMKPYTLRDLEKQFPDDAACLEWLKNYLYPNGIDCKKCGRVTLHHRAATRPSYCCDRCGNHVHPTAGTIYHKSSTPLRLWFYAVFLMASTRCGISAKQLERELGVTYKTAWRMFKQIRSMLGDDAGRKMYGRIEIDETYVGGKRRRTATTTGFENKTPVLGIAERDTKTVNATAMPDATAATVMPIIQDRVPSKFTKVYTDESAIYNRLTWLGYGHETVHHSSGEYVRGDIHTNRVEGFWQTVKLGIHGVYHGVSRKYLQSYLNEYTFRYNHRHQEQPMFLSFLGRVERGADSIA